jgi:hypothetical protein
MVRRVVYSTMQIIKIESLPWEDLVAAAGQEYCDFYNRCLHFNKPGNSVYSEPKAGLQ